MASAHGGVLSRCAHTRVCVHSGQTARGRKWRCRGRIRKSLKRRGSFFPALVDMQDSHINAQKHNQSGISVVSILTYCASFTSFYVRSFCRHDIQCSLSIGGEGPCSALTLTSTEDVACIQTVKPSNIFIIFNRKQRWRSRSNDADGQQTQGGDANVS